MTRETKIGLLVGLTVIVLIGVLMSDYLNKSPVEPREAQLSQTMGDRFRQAQLNPGQLPSAGQALAPVAGRGLPAVGDAAQALPLAAGVEGPRVEAPAVPQPLSGSSPLAGGVQTRTVAAPLDNQSSAVYVPAFPQQVMPRVVGQDAGNAAQQAAAAPAGQDYKVQHGDTLSRIARHFYGSASRANIDRIIQANRRLKDIRTPLLAGETLTIPGAPGQAQPAPVVLEQQPAAPRGRSVIGLPGRTRVEQSAAPAPAAQRALTAPQHTTYTVKKGDTLASIAKQLLGSSARSAVEKLARANGIKDVNTVRVGQVIRMP